MRAKPFYAGEATRNSSLSDVTIDYIEEQKQSTTDEPPDGGLVAWTQALCMHIVFFNTWGIANGYGVFQTYYTETLHQTPSSIAWIGSIQVFLLFFLGIVTGRLSDAGWFRHLFFAGVGFQLLGIFMTALASTYWQIFLSQAVCLGLGNGLTFCPALATLSQYFKRNRAFAVGIGASGAAVGGLIYPVMIDQLLHHDRIGFPWTLRVVGLVMLITYIPCLIWLRPRLPPRQTGVWFDFAAFKEAPFSLFTVSMFLNFWGLYFAFFYLGTFAKNIIGVPQPVYLLMILNGVGILGRLLPPLLADRCTGLLNLAVAVSFLASIVAFCWPAVRSTTGLYVFAVIYGLLAAAAQALYPAAATTMTPDPSRTGARTGMILGVVSLANLTGPAICGALIQAQHGSYIGAEMFAGSCIFLGACFALAARLAKSGLVLIAKV